jgi:phosphatidate cytidylyltransferase
MSAKNKKLGDLFSRLLISGASIAIIGFLIYIAEVVLFRPVFTAGIAAISSIALWEYYKLTEKKQLRPAIKIGIVTAICYIFAVFFKTGGAFIFTQSFWKHMPEIILGLSLFSTFVYYAISKKEAISNLAATFFGIVYVVIPLSLFVRIAYFFVGKGELDPHFTGSFWLIYLLAVTKAADMGGYFIGRIFGRRKLALKLSPNKTLEGAIAGLISSIIVSLFIIWIGKSIGYFFADISYFTAIYLGLLIGIFGQMGDLAESLLKRDAAAKDSNTIRGVGGILDMCDSLLFAAPLLYIFLLLQYS